MFKRFIFAVLLMLVMFIPACGDRDPIDIDFVGTDAEFAAAQHAAKEWNETCKRDLIHVYRGPGDDVATSGQKGLVKGKSLGVTHCHCDDAQWILFQSDSKYPLMEILAHEFGHAVLSCTNYDHEYGGLMRAQLNASLAGKDGNLVPGAITQDMCDAALK